jgi:hypothetical protein
MPPQMVLHTDPGSEPFEPGFFRPDLQRPALLASVSQRLIGMNGAVRHSPFRSGMLDRRTATMLARIGVMRALNRHVERGVLIPTAKSITGGARAPKCEPTSAQRTPRPEPPLWQVCCCSAAVRAVQIRTSIRNTYAGRRSVCFVGRYATRPRRHYHRRHPVWSGPS